MPRQAYEQLKKRINDSLEPVAPYECDNIIKLSAFIKSEIAWCDRVGDELEIDRPDWLEVADVVRELNRANMKFESIRETEDCIYVR